MDDAKELDISDPQEMKSLVVMIKKALGDQDFVVFIGAPEDGRAGVLCGCHPDVAKAMVAHIAVEFLEIDLDECDAEEIPQVS